jgi:hypothetical protein
MPAGGASSRRGRTGRAMPAGGASSRRGRTGRAMPAGGASSRRGRTGRAMPAGGASSRRDRAPLPPIWSSRRGRLGRATPLLGVPRPARTGRAMPAGGPSRRGRPLRAIPPVALGRLVVSRVVGLLLVDPSGFRPTLGPGALTEVPRLVAPAPAAGVRRLLGCPLEADAPRLAGPDGAAFDPGAARGAALLGRPVGAPRLPFAPPSEEVLRRGGEEGIADNLTGSHPGQSARGVLRTAPRQPSPWARQSPAPA